jgi:hypothetical protein
VPMGIVVDGRMSEFRHCMWDIFRYGFKVGIASFVAMLVLHLMGWQLGVTLAETAFAVGFFPMMAAGVILMVMHHMGWGRDNATD